MLPRIYLDTNFFIHTVEGEADLAEACWRVLALGTEGVATLVSSELTLAEVLAGPIGAHNEGSPARHAEGRGLDHESRLWLRSGTIGVEYLDLIATGEGLEVVPIDRSTLVLAAHWRAVPPRPKLPDAIHLATLEQQACRYAISDDRRFRAAARQLAVPVEVTIEALGALADNLTRRVFK